LTPCLRKKYNALVLSIRPERKTDMSVDLHTHSTASDGSCTPAEVARECVGAGIKIASLTDHDTAGGQKEFLETCRRLGLAAVTGIEFSTVHKGREVHLLGYGLPLDDPRFSGFLREHAAHLKGRLTEILRKLASCGFDLSIDEIYEVSGGNPPMPPHLLRVLGSHGYVPDLAAAVDFFQEYLAFNARAWVDHETSLEKPLEMLIDVGAIAVVSHPFRLPGLDWLEEILDMGAHGLELYYPGQTGSVFLDLESIALRRGCIVTGGCDFHGIFAERRVREVEIPLEVGVNLMKAVGQEIPAALAAKRGASS